MGTHNVIVERDAEISVLAGWVPGWLGTHSQADALDEVGNLRKVLEMLLDDAEPDRIT